MRPIREHLSIFFAYVAYRVAPKEVRHAHLAALYHIQGVGAQIQLGREWGVGTMRWAITEHGAARSLQMETEMQKTAKRFRAQAEWVDASRKIYDAGGEGVPAPQDPAEIEPEFRRKPDLSGDADV